MTFSFDWSYLNDALQIAILYGAFYGILKAARGSRFGQALTGVGLLFCILIAFTYLFHFDVLALIVRWLLIYLAISSVVIFQPEIRRILATLGSFFFAEDRGRLVDAQHVTPEVFVDAIMRLAKARQGALLAFERAISLRGYETSGVALDARFSTELLVTIFTQPLPLHDGGVIVRRGRLASAHCLFPVSSHTKLSASGMRHRAAVGLSEETDALIIVVSEETGRISLAHNGRLIRFPESEDEKRATLLRWLRKALPVKKTPVDAFADWLRQRSVWLSRKIAASKERA